MFPHFWSQCFEIKGTQLQIQFSSVQPDSDFYKDQLASLSVMQLKNKKLCEAKCS